MLINCKECGKEISDKAKACPNCGAPIKIQGRGFSIASLVLGILSVVYTFPFIPIAFESGGNPENFLSVAVAVMPFGILALIFGIVSRIAGCKLVKSIAGILMGSLSIIALVVVAVIINFI